MLNACGTGGPKHTRRGQYSRPSSVAPRRPSRRAPPVCHLTASASAAAARLVSYELRTGGMPGACSQVSLRAAAAGGRGWGRGGRPRDVETKRPVGYSDGESGIIMPPPRALAAAACRRAAAARLGSGPPVDLVGGGRVLEVGREVGLKVGAGQRLEGKALRAGRRGAGAARAASAARLRSRARRRPGMGAACALPAHANARAVRCCCLGSFEGAPTRSSTTRE
jgi:hypothetical protein